MPALTKSLRRRFSCIRSAEAANLLYPNHSDAELRLEALRGEVSLIRLPHGPNWEYPTFQFDIAARAIIPIVAYANADLKAETNPWGALAWWETQIRIAGTQTPLELLARGQLTTRLVDNLTEMRRQAM
ncbi:hypothetical protein ACIBM3_15430 [Rhodococcus erythropolis]|uniref:hypothetical protein n=1 Tax=Rhodococcus erythropolis TaxID=1833 RepID=UPI0037AC2927